MTNETITLRGGCHCGQLGIEFTTLQNPATINPRACDCSFCRKHGAAYVSDPGGTLVIAQAGADGLLEYQQGSDNARFLLCPRCGVLVAVAYRHASGTCGAINAACLDGEAGFGQSLPASPQHLSAEEKIARWLKMWIPDVRFIQKMN